jgi:hypothetical protein
VVQVGKCFVAWGNVQRPLEIGRLSIKNLKLLGSTLRSWGMMDVREDIVTMSFFKASMFFILGDGITAVF